MWLDFRYAAVSITEMHQRAGHRLSDIASGRVGQITQPGAPLLVQRDTILYICLLCSPFLVPSYSTHITRRFPARCVDAKLGRVRHGGRLTRGRGVALDALEDVGLTAPVGTKKAPA